MKDADHDLTTPATDSIPAADGATQHFQTAAGNISTHTGHTNAALKGPGTDVRHLRPRRWDRIELGIPAPLGHIDIMRPVLSISSQVSRGHVGNSATTPALQALGCECWALPTVILANRPDHGSTAGFPVAATELSAMIRQFDAMGWLASCGGLLTGYFRTAEQVAVAADAVARMRVEIPDLVYCCDPIIGDEQSGPYVPEEVATAIRDRLVPLADIVTPNRFELEWLTGTPVTDLVGAQRAAARLGVPSVLATSVPPGGNRIATALIDDREVVFTSTAVHDGVPKGTGDVLAALFLAHRLNGRDGADALALAAGALEVLIEASRGYDELQLAPVLATAVVAQPLPVQRMRAGSGDGLAGAGSGAERQVDELAGHRA